MHVRESMSRLPFQRLWTILTGKSLLTQKPLWPKTWLYHIVTATMLMAGGALSAVILTSGLPTWAILGLPLSWVMLVNGARRAMILVVHQIVHERFSGHPMLDVCLAEVLTTILFVQPYAGYRRDHIRLHHSAKLATPTDPDMAFLIALGFRPGLSRRTLWRRLCWTIFSPSFHLQFLRARVRTNLLEAPAYRRLMSLGYLAGLTTIGLLTSWASLIVAWVFPLTILLQISSFLQFISEHVWLNSTPEGSGRERYAAKTLARFCGEAAPVVEGSLFSQVVSWSRWWLRMLTVHLFARSFVVIADLPAHDWHHRHPLSQQWPDALYARERDVEAGHPGWPPYEEVWGLVGAIDKALESISAAEEEEVAELLGATEADGILLTM